MKKSVFAISVLSLAIAGANQVYAEGSSSQAPQSCVVEGGQGESLNEWGMWCGVGSFLAALSEMDPTAAGPGDGPEQDLNVNPPGRGDADNFEPTIAARNSAHIVLPEAGAGDFVGYSASQDRVGEEMGYGAAVNHQTGGFALSLEDGSDGYGMPMAMALNDGYGEPVEPGSDIAEYSRYDSDGNLIDSRAWDSENDGGNPSGGQITDVYLTDAPEQPGNVFALRETTNPGQEGGEDQFTGDILAGMEAVVLPGDDSRDVQILKNYWAGFFGRYDSVSEREMMGGFVTGELTALNEIQALMAGDVTATYSGNSHQWNQSVRLEVDFGAQRFTGEFGDMDMYRKMDAGITDNADMSFTASGIIEGVNLISETVSADTGFVQGSFFGDQGGIIGGAYDVTKGANRVVDVFTAVEGENNIVIGGGGPR